MNILFNPLRRIAHHALVHHARSRVRLLDSLDIRKVQEAILFDLLTQARDTRFGREHGFQRIESLEEYQRRVPLREYETFWREYWMPAHPLLDNITWAGRIPYLALSSGTTSGSTKYLPVSPAMLASNRKAAVTTLSFFLAQHSDARLFTGRTFFLGGSTDLTTLNHNVRAGDLSGIAACEQSAWMKPFTYPPVDVALINDWEIKVQRLAEESAKLNITALTGVPSWLLVLFERLKQVTGKRAIADIWPNLRLIVHGGIKFDPYRDVIRREIGSDQVHFLETYPCSEGFVATEDPRHGLLRVIPDINLFFEFVPVEELHQPRPTRHALWQVEPGVSYAVVLTTCAGLWSYLLGDTVCFERRDPPLLRFTGRTKYYLSAFGEHLISEEIERAMARVARDHNVTVLDFHVGPVFPARASEVGKHRYLIEFAECDVDCVRFGAELDAQLSRINEDYQAHRQGDLSLAAPEVIHVPRHGFADWMRSKGKLGGQHKVPRMDNTGQITREMSERFLSTGLATSV